MSARVDKAWQDKGLGAYPDEALVGTLGHYGIVIDEGSFQALAKELFPLAIGARWAETWKGTGKFKDFPFVAADELWRRWNKAALAPNALAISLLELLKALGRLEGKGEKLAPEAAFAAVEAGAARLPPEGEARERFMAEVVQAMGRFLGAFDTAAEAIARAGDAATATRLADLEERLFPVRRGVARVVVDAVLGKEPQAGAKLEALSVEASRDAFARAQAVDALLHLEEPTRAAPGLFKLLEDAVAQHDHGLAEVALARLKLLLKALPEGSLKDEAVARAKVFIEAFDHHH